ncbi:MAG: deoxyhypusine synthase family protein [Promethearchaeota archaeon]
MNDKDFKEKLKKVKQFKIDNNERIVDLMEQLSNTGFNAKRLGRACKIYEEMILDDDCTIFFGLAGAIVPAGFQGIIHDFIESGFIDVLVTTGANITHDLAETLGYHHLQGDIDVDEINDVQLHDQNINRIYDVFLPNEVYEGIEDFISSLDIKNLEMPVSEFLKFLGEQIPDNKNSILKVCAKKNIPIFCPAFTDCGLALQLGFHYKNINLNHFKDMLKMVDLAWDAKVAGTCLVGGGVPKNFIFQSLQFCPNSAKYAIQITMDRPEQGGLSGATLKEAMSWGKVAHSAQTATIIADATIVLPIMYWYLKKVIEN